MTRVLVGKLDASDRWRNLGFASIPLNLNFRFRLSFKVSAHLLQFTPGILYIFCK